MDIGRCAVVKNLKLLAKIFFRVSEAKDEMSI